MKKNRFLDSIQVTSPCGQSWDEMSGGDKVRFCGHCALEVNNLSEMSRKEAERIVRRSEGRICVRYVKNPETGAPVFARQLYQISRRAGLAAAGALGVSLTLSTLAYAQGGVDIKAPSETRVNLKDKSSGEIRNEKPAAAVALISGTLTDPNGVVIPSIEITLANQKTGERQNAVTNDEGFYEFKNLPAGIYSLKSVAAGGFRAKEIREISINEGENLKKDVSLELAEVGEFVVLGGAIAVDYQHPLTAAVSAEDLEQVKDLIARGANVNAKDKTYDGTTALHIAVETGKIEIVKYLLDMGAKINVRDKKRRTPLMSIDDDATPQLVRILLDHGAKVNAFDAEGNTPLIIAAENENAEILRVLLNAGATLDAQNKNGRTALMAAAENDQLESVKILLEAGANPKLKNKENETAWDLTSDENIEKLLEPFDEENKSEK